MITKIYVLCDPCGGEIRYIGKTSSSLAKRLCSHLCEARRGILKTYEMNWLRSILSVGHLPIISLIGEVEGDGIREEIAWIDYGKSEGWRLTNKTKGGEGCLGYKHSEEMKRHLSQINTGKHYSLETRKKISEAQRGKIVSKEARINMGNAKRGIPKTEEHKQKISESNKGKKHNISEEGRRKMLLVNVGRVPWNKGKSWSEEMRHKLSLAHIGKNPWITGKHHSEESKNKMRIAREKWLAKGNKTWITGRHHSEETKQKIRITKARLKNAI